MRHLLLLCALALASEPGLAAAASPLTPTGSSQIWFDGTSNVRDYSCEATRFSARVGDRIQGAEVEIPVSALECGNDTMNRHMRNALDPAQPILFEVTSYRAVGHTATVTGDLSIRDETLPVELTAAIVPGEQGQEVRAIGHHELAMTDFGVKPPTLMLGTMRVHPEVTVHFELAFPPEALEQLAPGSAGGPGPG